MSREQVVAGGVKEGESKTKLAGAGTGFSLDLLARASQSGLAGDLKCYGNSKLHLGSNYARIQRELMATDKLDI